MPELPTQPYAPAAPSTQRGRFTIERLHAQGGLGQVSLAREAKLNRRVALKEIRPDRRDAELRRRFLTEAEVTGRLEHPGIVPVYTLDQDDAGEPYYVMRFIQGRTMYDAIQAYHQQPTGLAFRSLLQNFVSVCQTVAYAHSQGVIHRDLKPENVMLGDYGETLVIDWGLAKQVVSENSPPNLPRASDHRSQTASTAPSQTPGSWIRLDEERPGDANRTSQANDSGDLNVARLSGGRAPAIATPQEAGGNVTLPGDVLGTPQFMAPEQAEGWGDRVGPRSDIYSLGAMLYDLLTGLPPFLESNNILLMSNVRAGIFPPPRRVQGATPRALEAICLKAMSLKPEDRYATAKELAADVEHWLADEPVSAFAEPWLVRIGRWARKHRTLVTSAAAVLLVAAIGATVAAIVFGNLNGQLELALEGEKTQTALAQTNEAEAKERAAESAAVLVFFEERVVAAGRPKGVDSGLGHDVKLVDAMKASLPFVDSGFKQQPRIVISLRLTMARSFLTLGDPKSAANQYEKSRALCIKHLAPDHRSTLLSISNLALCYNALGRYADSLKLHEEALPLMKATFGPYHRDTLACMVNLANTMDNLGRKVEALKLREDTLALQQAKLEPYHPDALKTMINIASSYEDVGRPADALKLREQMLPLLKSKLGPDHPDTLFGMHSLAASYAGAGRQAEALKLREETLALRKVKLGVDNVDTLDSMQVLATAYSDLGRHAEALKLREENLALRRGLLGADHPDTLTSILNLAVSYAALGRNADALKLREEGLPRMQAILGPDHPTTLLCMWGLAESLARLNRGAEAVPIIDDLMKRAANKVVHARLVPGAMDIRLRHFAKTKDAAGCRQTAEMWEQLNRADVASLFIAAQMRAVTAAAIKEDAKIPAADATRLANAEADKAMAWLKRSIAQGYGSAGNLANDDDFKALRERADFKPLPEAAMRNVMANQQRLAAEFPDNPEHRFQLAFLGNNFGWSLGAQGRHADAEIEYRRAEAVLAKLAAEFPHEPRYRQFLANSHTNLGNSFQAQGRLQDAEAEFRLGLELRKRTAAEVPTLPILRQDLVDSYNKLGSLLTSLGRNAEVVKLREEMLAFHKTAFGPDHPETLNSVLPLAECLLKAGRGAEAVPIIDDCLKRAVGKEVQPRLILGLMFYRARHFEMVKDAAGCRQTAEMWEHLNRTDAVSLYEAACFRGVTAAVLKQDVKVPAADATRLANEEGDKAMALLKQAVAKGYKDIEQLKKDDDLKSLRNRADFQKLLADWERQLQRPAKGDDQ